MTLAVAEPYWRRQRRVFRGGRLEWYGDEPSEEFWGDLWGGRLRPDYFAAADRGDLGELEGILVRHLNPEGRHLEAGCGLGYWVAALRARGYEVEGVESSPALIRAVADARPDMPVRVADAMSLDVPDGHFDGYLSFGVVEHRRGGPEPFLAEAARVVRPGGRMILSVPFLCPLRRWKGRVGLYARSEPGGSPAFFQYAYGEAEIRRLLGEHGFQVDEIHHQQVQRALVEEVPAYFRLNRMRGARFIRSAVVAVVPAALAGHMVLFVATRDS